MTWGYVAIAGATLITGVMANQSAKKSAANALAAQKSSAQGGIDVQQQQFEAIQALLAPYVSAGQGAIGAQQGMLGLAGPEAQQAAIQGVLAGPEFKSLAQQGENAILSSASATGGLRGGNVQGALAQFRPNLLSQLLESRFNKLSQLTQIGQASAAGQASAGLQTGTNIANLLGQIGQAQAGAALATGQANANMYNQIGNTASTLGTLRLMGKF